MITGIVTESGVPVVELVVAGQTWRAIIDTGFNGELELPDRIRPALNAECVGRSTSILAAGQRIQEDPYFVDFSFMERMLRAEATFYEGDEILIGTSLLQDYRLTVDFPARTVVIA